MENHLATKQEKPRCICCGSIGTVKKEAVLPMPYLLIGVMLMLFWGLPKPADFSAMTALGIFVFSPLPMRIMEASVAIFLSCFPDVKERVSDIWSNVYNSAFYSEYRWLMALAVGIIYFVVLILVRSRSKNRVTICKKCKAIDSFTYFYE